MGDIALILVGLGGVILWYDVVKLNRNYKALLENQKDIVEDMDKRVNFLHDRIDRHANDIYKHR